MSKNRNRKKLDKQATSREYRIILLRSSHDYCLVCSKRNGNSFLTCQPSWIAQPNHGNGRPIENHKYRSYKSWKNNRLTQYK